MLNKLHGQPESYDKKSVKKSFCSQDLILNLSLELVTSLAKRSELAPMAL